MSESALIVGKNPEAIAFVVNHLGVSIEQAAGAAAALGAIEQRKFKLIVYRSSHFSDELLDFCIATRRIDREVPLAVIAQCPAVEDRVLTLDMGADELIDPEVPRIEQKARLTALLRRADIRRSATPDSAQQRSTRSYKIDDLEIDLDKKQARLKGRLLPLTPTEYSLLETLASHLGKTLSRTQLSDILWGYDSDVYEANIKWHVCRLRKKLGTQQSALEYILTVRNRGYRLLSMEERAEVANAA